MNGYSRRDRESGDAQVTGSPRSPFQRFPIRLNFLSREKHPELLLPSASDCAWVRAIAKDQRRRLDGEPLAGFNQSADPSTYRRKNSVRTTRATPWLACGITDLRNGFDGLAGLVQTKLAEDPFSGQLFVFRGRRGDRVKVLWWDGDGLCLFAKRLERGRFVWPQATSGTVHLTAAQLSMLLEGIDWRRPRRTHTPELAV